MATTLETLNVVVSADTSEFNSRLSALSIPGGPIAKIGVAAAAAATAATAAIAGFATAAIGKSNELETAMTEVFKLLPDKSDEAKQEMTQDVRDMATEFGISADKMASSLALALSSGVSEENGFEFMRVAAEGAVASGEELDEVVRLLAGNYNAFSQQGLSVQEVMDSIFKTMDLGVGTFNETGSAISKVAPVAVATGVSLDEVAASLATMTVNGIGMAEAGTGVNRMLIELNDRGSKVGKQFEAVAGQTFPEFIASGGTLEEALQLLKGTTDDAGISIDQLFGMQTAGMAALTLTGAGAEYLSGALEDMGDSAGSTERAYEMMAATNQQSIERIKTKTDELLLKLGDQLLPMQGKLLAAVEAAFPTIETIIMGVFDAISTAIEYVTNTVVPNLIAGWNDTNETSNVFTAIGALVRGAFDVIKAAFELGVSIWENVLKPSWEALEPFIRPIFDALVTLITGAFDSIKLVFDGVSALLDGDYKQAWEDFKGAVEGIVNTLWSVVETLFNGGIEAIKGIWDGFKTSMDEKLTEFRDAFSSGFEALKTKAEEIFNNFKDALVTIWQTLFGDVEGKWNEFKDTIKAAFDSFKTDAEGKFNAVKDAVASIWQALFDAVDSKWTTFRDNIQNAFEAFKTKAKEVFDGVKTAITDAFENTFNEVRSKWNEFSTGIRSIVDGLVGGVTAAFQGFVAPIGQAWTEIESKITEVVTGIGNTVRDLFSNAVNNVASIFNGITDAVKGPINSAIDLVNGFINKFNSWEISIPSITIDGFSGTVPDWVPGIGGDSFGVGPWTIGGQSFGMPDVSTIPHLAKGGIVSSPTLAMIGEGRESEAVIPLSKLDAMTGTGSHTINVHLDGRVIARTTVQHMPSVLDIHGVGY